jgi:hypothetical protein
MFLHMVNRNDLCPCGSGKKFKKCCINKALNPMEFWKERALVLGTQYPNNEKLVNTFFAIFDYSLQKNWRGACHGVSSILFILLKEQGIDCKLQLGFVKAPAISFPFCHSWITIEGEVLDIGLYRSNPPIAHDSYIEVSPPIFKGTDLQTNNPTLISFGITSNRESSDRNYQLLSQMTLGDYMKGWPLHKEGLWGETVEIAKRLNLPVNVQELKAKYANESYRHQD